MNTLQVAKTILKNYNFTDEQKDKYLQLNSNYERQDINEGFAMALVYFLRIDITENQIISPGSSKIGGYPDLPNHLEFPEKYVFIGQFNIADFKSMDIDNVFPDKGIIYLFSSGLDAKTLFFDGPINDLKPREYPNFDSIRAKDIDFLEELKSPKKIAFTPSVTLSDEFYLKNKVLTKMDWNNFENMIPGFSECQSDIHLLGLGNYLQGGLAEARDLFGDSFPIDDYDIDAFHEWEEKMADQDTDDWVLHQFHFFSFRTNCFSSIMNFWVDAPLKKGYADKNFKKKIVVVGSST